ncbi:MAG: GGDEF domain-containing protein [Pseudomonadota bacterium]
MVTADILPVSLNQEIVRYQRSKRPFCIIMADIDHFKRVNDTYGHDTGDFVLKSVAQVFIEKIRAQDIVARWGGEEFIFLLPESNLAGAAMLAEKIRQAVANRRIQKEEVFDVTITCGVCQFEDSSSLDECIALADAALYQGKEQGRNQVVEAERRLAS